MKMPGYESQRFDYITELEKEELMCGICLAIVDNPFIANCCKNLYCFDCINEWLSCSNTCPYDRGPLQLKDMQKSEKHFNIVENLEIHCENESFGCKMGIILKNLSQHLESCVYEPEKKCDICGLTMGDIDGHNCVQILLKENQKIKYENIKLTNNLDQLRQNNFNEDSHCWEGSSWCMLA